MLIPYWKPKVELDEFEQRLMKRLGRAVLSRAATAKFVSQISCPSKRSTTAATASAWKSRSELNLIFISPLIRPPRPLLHLLHPAVTPRS